MNEAQTALSHLERLAARGRQIGAAIGEDPNRASLVAEMRLWQADVAVAVNELSGGSKAHWLSKAFSAAFLITTAGRGDRALVVEAPAAEIVVRVLDVIEQARLSLRQVAAGIASFEPPPPRRFEFVRDAAVRPVLEQAYIDAERALDAGDAVRAFMTLCSVLEAVITDALHHAGIGDSGFGIRSDSQNVPTFDQRIATAESTGLIHASCARLPQSARQYRERRETDPPVTIRDASVVRQVLRVVMRDLDPGR